MDFHAWVTLLSIKMVYYGNTKEDAANIGFRDGFIYKFINNSCSDENVLKFESMDREETIKTFEKYVEKPDKTIY